MEGRAALWTLVGTMVAFKVITIALIVLMVPSAHAVAFMVLMSWYWVPILGALVAAPALVWLRLLRARARRAQLQRQEWQVDDEPFRDDSWSLSGLWQQSPDSLD